jgi:hypothetical protein
MAEQEYTLAQFQQAEVEIEEETGFSGYFSEPSSGLESEIWRETIIGSYNQQVIQRAKHIAWLERQQ